MNRIYFLLHLYNPAQQHVLFLAGSKALFWYVMLYYKYGILYFFEPLPPLCFYTLQLFDFYPFFPSSFLLLLLLLIDDIFEQLFQKWVWLLFVDTILSMHLWSPFFLMHCCPEVPIRKSLYLLFDLTLNFDRGCCSHDGGFNLLLLAWLSVLVPNFSKAKLLHKLLILCMQVIKISLNHYYNILVIKFFASLTSLA